MRKTISFLICVMLLLTMAAPAYADQTGLSAVDQLLQDGRNQLEGEDDEEDGDDQQGSAHEHSWTVTDTATCDQPGTITKTCSCGVSETQESPATGNHTYSNWTDTGDGKHGKTCSACGNTEKADHNYGGWASTGEHHSRSCSVCGASDQAAHRWGSAVVVKKPTCKEVGYMGYYCSVCNFEHIDLENPIEKLTTHTYDSACDPECNVCGVKRAIEHTYTTTWSKDYNGHWHECTKCGDKKDEAKHVPGPAATEEKEQVCMTCSYVIAPKKNHVHSYGTEWTSDETGHWHACTGCDEEKGYAVHSFDDECDPECNTCGYKRENSHTYDTEGWLSSKFEHWNICTVCGEESEHEKHVPGEEATDKAAQVCTVCNYELAPMLEHAHDFGTIWIQSQDSHWQECECGELSVPEPHIWDSGKKNRNDTVTYTCTICDAEKTEEAPSSGFPWLTVILVILALVCLGGIATLVIILKRGGFDDESDEDEEYEEEYDDNPDDRTEEDEEEKMIEDYFASLDQELYK